MAQVELIMPKMGESVAEATIINWLKQEGDVIELDEAVVEIATDKVDSEVPSTTSGTLIKKLFNEGDIVQVGQAIAIIGSESDGGANTSSSLEKAATPSTPTPVVIAETVAPILTSEKITKTSASGKFYSPLVRSIAEKEGISLAELEQIEGTGNEGRVTKTDMLNYIPTKGKMSPSNGVVVEKQAEVIIKTPDAAQPKTTTAAPKKAIALMEGDEIEEMDRMRKLIAAHMVDSKHTSPHVTSYVEADVTNIVLWRNKIKNAFEKKENEKITFTPIFIEAIVKAIKDFPQINISVDGENIIKRKHINIGMATALPSGNLIVPVIKDADRLNLVGLTKAVNDLANRARNNKLSPDDISGGTYTITNVGSFGNVMGTPIINQPQVAIMAVGAIQKKPAVIETPTGDVIAIRHKMFLSHAYDHRVVDGALGGMFVRRVADYLEQFDVNREI